MILQETYRRRNRGVVLLVILALLAALALIGVAFITLSDQEGNSSAGYRDSFANPRVDLDPERVFTEALSQVIADTDNRMSVLRGHSLLRDLYGNDNDFGLGPDGRPGVAGVDDNGNGILDDYTELGWPGSDDSPNGVIDAFDYYQRAFNGPGEAGPDGIVGNADDHDVNYVYNGRDPEFNSLLYSPRPGLPAGGFDEDYDYPDTNNMFLAAMRADGTVLVPSYHRPGYMRDPVAGSLSVDFTDGANTPGQGRRLVLRPRLAEHPSFGPGDLQFPSVAGVRPLDVDNNGDGIPDGVWLDIGFPVQTTLDGRKFKPLMSFLITDLDNRLNMNVHGTIGQDKIDGGGIFQFPNNAGDGIVDSHPDLISSTLGLLPNDARFPAGYFMGTGSGWSVSEVNLQNVFHPLQFPTLYGATFSPNEYRWLLEGRLLNAGPPIIATPGRWGETARLITAQPPRAGFTGFDDELPYSNPQLSGRGDRIDGAPAAGVGFFRNPADFDANGAIAMASNGRALYFPDANLSGVPFMGFGSTTTGWSAAAGYQQTPENIDEADEMRLDYAQSADAPFGPEELDYLYRYYDEDIARLLSQTPGLNGILGDVDDLDVSRLTRLAPSLFANNTPGIDFINRRRRNMLTTESWNLIHSSNQPTNYSASSLGQFPPIGPPPPLVHSTIGNGVFPCFNDPQFRAALPDSLLKGRRIQLDRPLQTRAQKQRLARELYTLMFALTVPDNNTVPRPQVIGAASPRPFSRRIAQWAINVVDFIDSDQAPDGTEETMTPFVFDWDPRVDSVGGDNNGWDVLPDHTAGTGNPARGVVWGVEAPRVYITEVLAYQNLPPQAQGNRPCEFWVELFNPTAFPIDLAGTGADPAYQLVLQSVGGSGLPNITPTGEPQNMDRVLLFDSGQPGTTVIPAGGYLVVAQNGSIPPQLSGGANPSPPASVPKYRPNPPLTLPPGPNTDFVIYLRRLADPTAAANPPAAPAAPSDQFTYLDSANPYLTVDSLKGECGRFLPVPPPANPPPLARSWGRNAGISVSADDQQGTGGKTHSIGEPNASLVGKPWPHLAFADRPISSPFELLWVPATSPQQLTTGYYDELSNLMVANQFNPYQPVPVHSDAAIMRTGIQRAGPFYETSPLPNFQTDEFLVGHLMNFFRELPEAQASPNAPSPGYYRIFEYLEISSRIGGSQRSHDVVGSTLDKRQDRIPGQININTIWEPEIWQALLNNHPAALQALIGAVPGARNNFDFEDPAVHSSTERGRVTSQLFAGILASLANEATIKSGFPVAGDGLLFTSDDRPFRSLARGMSATPPVAPSPIETPENRVARPSIHDTLLRGIDFAGGATAPALLNIQPGSPPGLLGQPGAPPTNIDYSNIKYQLLQKLGNSVTTRSNVYAVWMTVGFFEVGNEDPNRLAGAGIQNAPPELGAEINADIGTNIRHRGFYIVDRSRAKGYSGPAKSSRETQDILRETVIHGTIIE